MFATWCSGGKLIVVADDDRRDFRSLLSYLADLKIERLFLPYIALHQLADTLAGMETVPLNLKEIITAGEQLQITPSIAFFFNHIQSCRLTNQYGPTEAHVVTSFNLNGLPDNWPVLPPIGQPIANTEVYILDEQMEPVPVGISGEVYLGGVGLARGYLRRPELTAEKFVPHPYSTQQGARLYRTGDQARFREDGNLEFVGRKDQQVKLRGFRIELSEIEAVLNEHEKVREAVVALETTSNGDKRLVAYVVPRQEGSLLGVRQYLKQKLPDYMVPAVMVALEQLPLGSTGKVDRSALPGMGQQHPEVASQYIAPRTEVEETLARIWSAILALERIGVNDNFFELGGHSLLATQMRARIRELFDIEVPLVTVFERPTIAELAQAIGEIQSRNNGNYARGRIKRAEVAAEKILPSVSRLSEHEIDSILIGILREEISE
jgi:acyl-coenzyme A synthetase/AMP-(fatty) acid ligase/acyl carrier protein